MLRQSKVMRETLVQRCNNCLQSSGEAGATKLNGRGGSSQEFRSYKSDRSSTQATFKNAKASHHLTSKECTQCFNVKGTSRAASPFMPRNQPLDSCSSAASNRKSAFEQRSKTPNNDHLTFSNGRGCNIGMAPTGQGLQTMMSRSPNLIGRLAAEHEIYNQ